MDDINERKNGIMLNEVKKKKPKNCFWKKNVVISFYYSSTSCGRYEISSVLRFSSPSHSKAFFKINSYLFPLHFFQCK